MRSPPKTGPIYSFQNGFWWQLPTKMWMNIIQLIVNFQLSPLSENIPHWGIWDPFFILNHYIKNLLKRETRSSEDNYIYSGRHFLGVKEVLRRKYLYVENKLAVIFHVMWSISLFLSSLLSYPLIYTSPLLHWLWKQPTPPTEIWG